MGKGGVRECVESVHEGWVRECVEVGKGKCGEWVRECVESG